MEAGTLSREALDAAHREDGTDPETLLPEGVLEDGDGQFVLRIGGQAPTTNAVRLYGGAIEIEPPEDGFVKGGSYRLQVTVECHKVGLTDIRDNKTGEVIGCRDERGLRITGVALA